MMHAIASSSQVSLIKKSRIFVFPPRLSLPSLSQRKTVSCASLPAENLPSLSVSKISEENPLSSLLAEKLPSLSVSKISEDNPLPSKQVDWLSLTDEEFEEAIEAISSEFGPDCSKMNAEEFSKFCKRRGKHVDTCSRRLSELVGNVDLMTPWKRWRNRDFSFLACNDDEFKQLELPAVKEYHDPALKSRAKQAMLFAGPGYLQVPTLPMFFWDLKREELFIPRQSGVGIDTCLLIYLALRNVPQFQEKGLFVKNLLEQPIAFVISESVYVELLDVLLRESKPVPGIIPRSSLIKPRWVAYFVKEVANSGLRAFRSPVMKRWEKNAWKLQPDSLFKKLKNCDNYLSSEDMKFSRSLRLELVKELLKILRDFTFTQSEPGRGAYKNLFSLVSSTYVQPPDARIMLESVGPTVHLFFSEDLQHGQLFRCIRSKVTRGLLVWHILTHQVKYY